ncbi:MAG: hypothetical protein K8S99_15875 [Planctomycetes bacterium]|nr:hypothetical protein [Planctomycetota bacterium]
MSDAMNRPEEQPGGPPDPLARLLTGAARWLRLAELTVRTGRGITVMIAALLAAVILDAMTGLPPVGLVVLDVALAVALPASVIWVALALRQRGNPRALAIWLEQRLDIAGNPLINALDLSHTAGDGVSEPLRRRAIAQGADAAGGVHPRVAMERRPWRRAAWSAVGASALMLLSCALMPGVFRAVVPRLADPWGDHPPFTLLSFDVAVDPRPAYVGRAASIRARIDGPGVTEEASIVFVEPDGSRRRVPLLLAPRPVDGGGNAAQADAVHGRDFVLTIDRAERSRRFYVEAPSGRSEVHELTVLPVPLFERIAARYDFPAYTGWASRGGPVDRGVISALEGTRVTLTVTSNVPLRGGVISLSSIAGIADGKPATQPASRQVRLTPDAADPRRATAAFTVESSGEYSIAITGVDGTPGLKPSGGRLVCVRDAPPEVEIVEPDPVVIAPEGWPVQVQIEARDDIGLSRLSLHRGVNGKTPTPEELPLIGERPGSARATRGLAVDAASMHAGDVIRYFAVARDNKPPDGQSTDTPVHEIRVISMNEYLDLMQSQLRVEDLEAEWKQLEADLAALQAERAAMLEEMRKLQEKAGPPNGDDKKRMADLAKRLEQYEKKAEELAERARKQADRPMVFDFEDEFRRAAGETAEGLREQREAAKSLRGEMERAAKEDRASSDMKKQMERFAKTDRPFQEEDKQRMGAAKRDLETLRMADDLQDAAQRLQSLAERQRDLATRMAVARKKQGAEPPSPERMQRLAREQEELRRELEDVVSDLQHGAESAGERLPKMSESARQLADEIEKLDVSSDQLDGARLARQGDGPGASGASEKAASKLEGLLSQCEAVGEAAGNEIDRELSLAKPGTGQMLRDMAKRRAAAAVRRGGEGGGSAGAVATGKVGVVGPMPRSDRESRAEARRRGEGKGPGRAASVDDETSGGAERMGSSAATPRGGGGAGMPGVPATYRELTEAYFRRLAEDAQEQR